MKQNVTIGATNQIYANFKGHVGGTLKSKTAKYFWNTQPGGVQISSKSNVYYWGLGSGNPFIGVAPSIDLSIWIGLCYDKAKDEVKVDAHGRHNSFPSYELLINGKLVHHFTPSASGPSIWNLGIAQRNWTYSVLNCLAYFETRKPSIHIGFIGKFSQNLPQRHHHHLQPGQHRRRNQRRSNLPRHSHLRLCRSPDQHDHIRHHDGHHHLAI